MAVPPGEGQQGRSPRRGRRIRIGPENGTLLLRTRRAGFASRVGHDLTLELTAWSAEVEVPDSPDFADGRVEARVILSTLEVREGSGGAVPLTDRDRREIESNARRILEVDRHPTAIFAADRIAATETEATISGTLALHGASAPIVLHVRQVGPDRWHAVTTVAQTAFGIKPYSAFLGALKLQDEVAVECRVDLRLANETGVG
jgi:polyisoprenoid-binding protein YceI